MSFSEKQRIALIKERGEPTLKLEFDVFEDNRVSMWTHFDHSADFAKVKSQLQSVKKHLEEFLKDEGMCPFH